MKKTTPSEPAEALDYEEAARRLCISKRSLQRLVYNRKIGFREELGRGVRFTNDDLLEYLDKVRVDPIN
jgi:excisionase family DNA binding protein